MTKNLLLITLMLAGMAAATSASAESKDCPSPAAGGAYQMNWIIHKRAG